MDIGKFKASRFRLILWILTPPLIFVIAGFSAYAFQLQAEWELSRTQQLSQILPELVQVREDSRKLIAAFTESEAVTIQSEDDLISYIRDIERGSEFAVRSLEVERSETGNKISILTAEVKGEGTFNVIQGFLGDVVSGQHLLYSSNLRVTRNQRVRVTESDVLNAEIKFQIILLKSLHGPMKEGV